VAEFWTLGGTNTQQNRKDHMSTLRLRDIIGVIFGVAILAGFFSWLLQKPDGLFAIIVSFLAAGAFQSLKIGALERELKKLKEQSPKLAGS
jgi:hypothetical protein